MIFCDQISVSPHSAPMLVSTFLRIYLSEFFQCMSWPREYLPRRLTCFILFPILPIFSSLELIFPLNCWKKTFQFMRCYFSFNKLRTPARKLLPVIQNTQRLFVTLLHYHFAPCYYYFPFVFRFFSNLLHW